jgi:hypothetical protein
MKKIVVLLLMIFAVGAVAVFGADEVLEFKSKIGFTNNEDKIVEYKFVENDRKLLIIGLKNLQIWDVENAKLLNSVPHQIPQFAPRGFVSTYLLVGIPKVLSWQPFLVDPDGKWIITIEKVGDNPRRSAIVRDLQSLKQIAVMELPNVSTEYLTFDDHKNEILSFGITDKTGDFASWERDKFTLKEVFSIKEYKWHQKIRGERKMLVGSGDTKTLWGFNKQGDSLTLRDVKTGAVEKEFTAKNLKPDTSYQDTTVSPDEKLLIAERTDRIFVWEIDGDGQPKFEISSPNPKGDLSFKGIVDQKFVVVKIDEQLRIYDINGSGTPLFEAAPQTPKEDLDFREIIQGRFVVVEVGSKLRVFDTQGGTTLKFELVSDNPKDSVEYQGASADGKYIAVRDDRKISVIEVASDGKPVYEIVRNSEKERFPMVKIVKDKNLLAVARVNSSEKKDPKTEFYDVSTGKLAFDAGFAADSAMQFTPDDKFIYQSGLGYFSAWNMATQKWIYIGLATHTPSYDPNKPTYIYESSYNTESAEFSPDRRYILRYGDDVTAVFETETGNQVQTIFDAAKVKYDKKNQVKRSGLGEAGWIGNGKYVYAFESSNLFSPRNTVNLWQVKK